MRLIFPRHVLSALALSAAALGPLGLSASNPPGYPPFAKSEYTPARLGPHEPDVEVDYPGSATARGIPKGMAVVSILVGADGKAIDYLLVNCTDPAFGTALLDEAKTLKFAAANFKGIAVPARFNLGYNFVPNDKSIAVNAMDAARAKIGGIDPPAATYSAVSEGKLDRPLEFTRAVMPQLPADYRGADAKTVMVFVTFYVDEQGHARAPNVESAVSPGLIPAALRAVAQWSFKPPLAKGKPALVFAGRAVGFVASK